MKRRDLIRSIDEHGAQHGPVPADPLALYGEGQLVRQS
jgi:hypothetical protein